MYILEEDSLGCLVYSYSTCLRKQKWFASPLVGKPGSQITVVSADVLPRLGGGRFPAWVVLMVPLTTICGSDPPVTASAVVHEPTKLHSSMQQAVHCFPKAVALMDVQSSDDDSDSGSDDSRDEQAAGKPVPDSKRAKARTDGLVDEVPDSGMLPWSIVGSFEELEGGVSVLRSSAESASETASSSPAPSSSSFRLHPVVLEDLRAQYTSRPVKGSSTATRCTAFALARVQLDPTRGSLVESQASTEAASSASAGGTLMARLYGGSSHGSGAETPLKVVVGSFQHAQPAPTALFLPTRMMPITLEAAIVAEPAGSKPKASGRATWASTADSAAEDKADCAAVSTESISLADAGSSASASSTGASMATGKAAAVAAVKAASAEAQDLSQPWHAVLLTVGGVRRADGFGAGKTPSEATDEMRRRFASGSMRKLVPPSAAWADCVTACADGFGDDVSVPGSGIRMRKVVAAANADTFTLLERPAV